MRIRKLRRKAKLGRTLSVTLDTPASSGYAWVICDPAERIWRVLARESAPGAGFGAQVKDRFRIEMLRPGHALIAAELKRPWEKEPIERVEIDVDVAAA